MIIYKRNNFTEKEKNKILEKGYTERKIIFIFIIYYYYINTVCR